MKKVIIELYVPEDQEINDHSVGVALGIAIMKGELFYEQVENEVVQEE
jgi:hypothetical protein